MFNLILFGPPGSGKGTQSELIIKQFNLKHISTGDLLRSEMAEGTPLGEEAKSFMNRGQLVPDEVVIGMLSDAVDKNNQAKGFIFDGFPRTEAQAVALDKLLALKHSRIDLVLALDVPQDELVHRLLERGKTSGRADDANEEIIRARIVEYHKKTEPVANHYKRVNRFSSIAGDGSIEETFELVAAKIGPLVSAAV